MHLSHEMFIALATVPSHIAAWVRSRVRGDRGAALVEYALLVTFIAIVCIGTIAIMGTRIAERLTTTGGSIN